MFAIIAAHNQPLTAAQNSPKELLSPRGAIHLPQAHFVPSSFIYLFPTPLTSVRYYCAYGNPQALSMSPLENRFIKASRSRRRSWIKDVANTQRFPPILFLAWCARPRVFRFLLVLDKVHKRGGGVRWVTSWLLCRPIGIRFSMMMAGVTHCCTRVTSRQPNTHVMYMQDINWTSGSESSAKNMCGLIV